MNRKVIKNLNAVTSIEENDFEKAIYNNSPILFSSASHVNRSIGFRRCSIVAGLSIVEGPPKTALKTAFVRKHHELIALTCSLGIMYRFSKDHNYRFAHALSATTDHH